MTLPYGVISDPHYHRWDAFATTNADGLNSRLEIQLDATKEAAKAMKAAGCKHMLVAGDTFHVRGAISPSVLHFVTETYEWIIKELGLEVVMLAATTTSKPTIPYTAPMQRPLCAQSVWKSSAANVLTPSKLATLPSI